MATKTDNIASELPQDTLPNILTLSAALAPVLAAAGEATLIASVAHAIGVRRILDEASKPKSEMVCETVVPARGEEVQDHDAAGKAVHDHTITYYFAGCDGAKKLGKKLGRAIFKIGYTCRPPADRLDGLDAAAYGAWAASQKTLNVGHPMAGWTEWAFARYEPQDVAHVVMPAGVTVDKGLWRVRLPEGVDPQTFDRVVTTAMLPRQIAFWVMSGEGRVHCDQKGLNPEDFVRFARQDRTGVLRPVEELYAFSPRRDAGWFAAILGEALAHLIQGAKPN